MLKFHYLLQSRQKSHSCQNLQLNTKYTYANYNINKIFPHSYCRTAVILINTLKCVRLYALGMDYLLEF